MGVRRHIPYGAETFESIYPRCSVCGTRNNKYTTSSGGRYSPSFTLATGHTNPYTGGEVYTTTSGGCDHCGSPLWNAGGKGGDIVG